MAYTPRVGDVLLSNCRNYHYMIINDLVTKETKLMCLFSSKYPEDIGRVYSDSALSVSNYYSPEDVLFNMKDKANGT